MNNIDELKESLNKKLSVYGIDFSYVVIGNDSIMIDEHILSMDDFNGNIGVNLNAKCLTIQKNEYGLFIMNPDRDANEEMYDKFYEELTKIKQQILKDINDANNLLLSLNSYDVSGKTVHELISSNMKDNFVLTDSLSSVKNWKAKIILGNSSTNGKEVGDYDGVGYVCIGINTGTIVPIARSDEHHQGYDLIHFLIEQSLIPEDKYISIYTHGHYVDSGDVFSLAAFKMWRQLGGPNVVLNNWKKDTRFQITMDDYIKMNGTIIVNKGELLPIGQEFVNLLKHVAQVNSDFRENPNNLPKMVSATKKLIRYISTKVDIFLDVSEMNNALKIASEDENPQQKIEEFVFGFNGIKNTYHNKIRKELSKESKFNDEMECLFGDLELANHEFGSI